VGRIVGLFRPPVQEVPPTLRVFAMDQRGHGDADKPATGYALVNFADDVEAFMDAVAYSRLSCSGPPAVARSRNRSLSENYVSRPAGGDRLGTDQLRGVRCAQGTLNGCERLLARILTEKVSRSRIAGWIAPSLLRHVY
jgi:hypothetical protein